MAENNNIQRLMERLADAIIGLNMTARFAVIASARIDQECWERLSMRGIWKWFEYQTGSAYEGMPWTVCGDVDIMIASFNYPIVLCQSPTEGDQYQGGYVMSEGIKKEPAFLKLKVVDKDNLNHQLRGSVDNDGYLKRSSLIDNSGLKEGRLTEVHGPSVATSISEIHPSRGNQDTVPCIKCKSWPSVTHEFFTRERKSDWPSQELLGKVLSLGCLVVAVAHPDSQSKDVEWRWSFSLSERELIQEISGPIAKCMYALKALKNKELNYPGRPTPFCSYFIKTACLWMCETFPHTESYSVIDLIRKVLDWLIECYQKRILSHYFIPKQNLIGHLPRKMCDTVQRKLKELNSPDLWEFVMSTVGHGPFERHAINSMCKNLDIPGVNEVDDYKTLEANLTYHPRAEEELEQTITKLLPGGSLYDKYEYIQIAQWVRPDIQSLLFVIEGLLEKRGHPSEILRLPEEMILPIVSRIEDVVPKGYEKMSIQRLYRYLGNVYNYLLMYLRNTGYLSAKGLELYKKKPIEYYRRGDELVFPDKWSDQGIGGLALVIIHYYQNENYYALKEIFREAEPHLRKTTESVQAMNRQIGVIIQPTMFFTKYVWEADKKLLLLAETAEVGFIYLHPIALVFYIQSRVSLKNGNKKKASDIIDYMEEWLKPNEERISVGELIATTKSLIEILKEEVTELELHTRGYAKK